MVKFSELVDWLLILDFIIMGIYTLNNLQCYFQLPTTKVVGSNRGDSEVYSIQHYVMKFVSDLGQIGGFLWVLRFPPPMKLPATI